MIHVHSNNCKTTIRYVGKCMFLFSLCTNLLQIQRRSVPFFFFFFSVVVQLLRRVPCHPMDSARQASLSSTTSWSLLKLLSFKSVMPSNHLILCRPLLLLPSILPASGSFPTSRLFPSGGQSIGASASASVLPMNIQG